MDQRTENWVKKYMEIWRAGYAALPENMKEEQAKATACNGMMIAADYKLLLAVDVFAGSAEHPVENGKTPAEKETKSAPTAEKPLDYRSLAQVQKDDQIAKELQSKAAYDPTLKKWNTCTCGNTDINKTSTTGRPYQGCGNCKLYLNGDGTIRPFKKPEAKQTRV